jgi:hypothetical protein
MSELDRLGDCSDIELEAFGWSCLLILLKPELDALALLTPTLTLALDTPEFELADWSDDDLAAFGCSRWLLWFELELDELALVVLVWLVDFFLWTFDDIYNI